jgi:glycosyltransferase involved in cell wall biosynthesis
MISVIIAVYKKLDYLGLVLQSLELQSYKNFEVIIAEDNNAGETITFLEKARNTYSFTIQHVSQEDNGFRKTKILNEAVKISQGNKLVFIDGDCIAHRHFLKEYDKAISDKVLCYGRRTLLSERFTQNLLQAGTIKPLTYFTALLSGAKWVSAALYIPMKRNIHKQHRLILGCNWGTSRENIFKVNGFDEDYTRAGVGEDFDIDWRLKAIGLKSFSMKNKAIVYHLFHSANYNEDDTLFVENLMAEKKKAGNYFCVNGLDKE